MSHWSAEVMWVRARLYIYEQTVEFRILNLDEIKRAATGDPWPKFDITLIRSARRDPDNFIQPDQVAFLLAEYVSFLHGPAQA